ncbi:SDR family oxidoreductase [Halocatena pleomorpha]|uniref:SDR family oxidoreductase n=1 Tax=Halocatena pleomorpha TaxID=1785090 RepID=A0A3P3RE66_9EURY|nr:SDR family oxidoreductase [Halocatena pleomorpha]RRJ31030.1 SDR family oxidoreductase [Halocatena pleomorpha]
MHAAVGTTLTDERVVVTDGYSSVGLATARAIADQGGEVLITGRPDESPEELSSTREDTESGSLDRTRIDEQTLESTDEAAVKAFFDETEFDHLVCAGSARPTGGVTETDTETFRAIIDSVFWRSYYAAKHGVERLGKGSSVTFITGTTAERPAVQFAATGIGNAALETLMKYLAVETGPVRVNAVSPGRVDTIGLADDTRQTVARALPADRIGEPEDVADTVLFAVLNPHTTGTVIRVDGGDLLV